LLRYVSSDGADIYVYIAMNTLKPDTKGQTKADIAEIRDRYLDLCEDGDERLARVFRCERLPQPNYVLDTLPDKHQVFWKLKGFTLGHAEATLRATAQEFGGHPAAADSARVLRLPGFHSKKFTKAVPIRRRRFSSPAYLPDRFANRGRSWHAALTQNPSPICSPMIGPRKTDTELM